jgi:hypothetical protein
MTMHYSINYQLLAPLEVGHEADLAAKAHGFGRMSVMPTHGRALQLVRWSNVAAKEKSIDL